ncbi:ABC transporter permease [Microbacterium sp. CJ88]|uniref:ABC transporter permease n=1 Tax=Microbacterium sp. CJ88 TaxID=3445672 RepID=UPI003F65A40D
MADRPRPSFVLLSAAILIAALLLVPVGFVVTVVAQTGWDTLAPLVFRPRVGELLLNTVLLVLLGVPACVVVGVAGAWLVERSDLPGRRVWGVLLAAPLAVPAFVSSYAWVDFIPSIGGLGGGLLISVLAYAPLVYLPALAALRGLDPAHEDAARSLGLAPWAVFLRVVLPQLRLAIWGGGLVVGLHLLAEYGAFALIRFDTFTTAIIVQFQSTFAGPAANALGIVLTLLCLVLLVIEGGTRGTRRYARVGSGAPLAPTRTRLGWTVVPVVCGILVYLAAAVGVPLARIGYWLTFGDPWGQRAMPQAIGTTLALALAGAIVVVVLAMPTAWISVRYAGRAARILEGAGYLASSLPSIIIALALVTVTIRLVPSLYQTAVTVLVAYVIMFMPRALVSLRSGIAQAPPGLEDAARTLGVAPFAARARVTLPLIAPSVFAGAALVALGIANELTATLLLAPNGTRTLATEFWSASSSVAYSSAAPYALLLIAASVPAVAILFAQARRGSRVAPA